MYIHTHMYIPPRGPSEFINTCLNRCDSQERCSPVRQPESWRFRSLLFNEIMAICHLEDQKSAANLSISRCREEARDSCQVPQFSGGPCLTLSLSFSGSLHLPCSFVLSLRLMPSQNTLPKGKRGQVAVTGGNSLSGCLCVGWSCPSNT